MDRNISERREPSRRGATTRDEKGGGISVWVYPRAEPEADLSLVLMSPRANLARTLPLCMAQRIIASAARWRAREGKSSVFQASSASGGGNVMEILGRRCAALDVHKKTAATLAMSLSRPMHRRWAAQWARVESAN